MDLDAHQMLILEKFKIRTFSGPFSYLFVDFETALKIINTEFKHYFSNITKVTNTNYKIKYLPHWRMTSSFYINKTYSDEIKKNRNVMMI